MSEGITTDMVLKALEGLPDSFNVHVEDDAWYAQRSIYRLLGHVPEGTKWPDPVQCVRVRLPNGILELHPVGDGKVQIMCYCCFDGNPDRGIYDLDGLRAAVLSLRDHVCPPWPG